MSMHSTKEYITIIKWNFSIENKENMRKVDIMVMWVCVLLINQLN